MLSLSLDAILSLIAGAIAGCALAWLWRSRMMRNSIAVLHGESRAKYEQLKRDLEGRVTRLENDLLNAKEVIQVRDSAIAERDRLIRQQVEQLTDSTAQIARLTVENVDTQTQLAKQEASYATLDQAHRAASALIGEQQNRIAGDSAKLAQLEPIPAKLADANDKLAQTQKNLQIAQARFNNQDLEITRLHKRNVELEPLTIVVKDREAKLAELEGRLAEAVRVRETEIGRLKQRVAEMAALPDRLSEAEAKHAQLLNELDTLRRVKDEESEALQQQLKAIEILREQVEQRDAQALRGREVGE